MKLRGSLKVGSNLVACSCGTQHAVQVRSVSLTKNSLKKLDRGDELQFLQFTGWKGNKCHYCN